ncbi:ABC transporter permease [Alkaliphilus sp. B6464]|uniref:ABC transporter permease n=1 Tax=Alkaliphilus sp. B6464 TaxID=2731219 RepID=UPI001BAC27FF|nr:ABC-2 family transporter protein [Alkaliphilus sp. B6464]QUH19299.1 ABC-2 family transporter protein [Alkaliphilus sp. B6464]
MVKAIISASWKEELMYKVNIISQIIFGSVPLLINIFLWKSIFFYRNGHSIGNYDYNNIVSYFILVYFIQQMTESRSLSVELGDDIQSGNLNSQLLKPISFVKMKFLYFFSKKISFSLLRLIPVILFFIISRLKLEINSRNLLLFIVAFIMAIIIQFIMGFILGVITFWFEENTAILDFFRNIALLLSGAIVPLSFFPNLFFRIVSFLPFQLTLYFPIEILLNNLDLMAIRNGLLLQLLWVIIIGVLAIFLWRKGRKKYSGYSM